MPLDPKIHAQLILDPAGYLAEHAAKLDGKPGDYFVDHAGRHVPLVVHSESGHPSHAVTDGGPVPYAEWHAANVKPVPAPAVTPDGNGVHVVNP